MAYRSRTRGGGRNRYGQSGMKSDTDNEALMEQLQQLRKKYTALDKENGKHKVELQRANKIIAKKDKQYKKLLVAKFADMDDHNMAGKLNEIKSELMSIANLTLRCNDLEQGLTEKDEELKLLKSSMKFTLIKELQIEAQTYFDEARRLKQILDHRLRAEREAAEDRKWAGEEEREEREEGEEQDDDNDIEPQQVDTSELKNKMATLEQELANVQQQINQVDNNN